MQWLLCTVIFVVLCSQLVQAAPLTVSIKTSRPSDQDEPIWDAARHPSHPSNCGPYTPCSRPFTVSPTIIRQNLRPSATPSPSLADREYMHRSESTRTGGKAATGTNAEPESEGEENAELGCSCIYSYGGGWHGLALPALVVISIGMSALLVGRKRRQRETQYSALPSSDVEGNEKGSIPSEGEEDVESFDDSDYPMG